MERRTLSGELSRAVRPAVMPGAALALRRARRRIANVAEAVDLAFSFRFAGIRLAPQQVRSELLAFAELLRERRPRTVLEIGAARGATLFLFTQLADPEARIVTVDMGSAAWKSVFYRSFARGEQVVRLVRGDSHAAGVQGRVRQLLATRPVDLLFVDGDHTYEGVKQDFETYSALVPPGGLIALHDIVPGDERLVGGVPRFWRELGERYPTRELVESWDQRGFGIGLVDPWRPDA